MLDEEHASTLPIMAQGNIFSLFIPLGETLLEATHEMMNSSLFIPERGISHVFIQNARIST